MNETTLPLLLPALIWPLLLAVAVAFGGTRSMALRLTPWAALPALAVVVIPETKLHLGSAILESALVLDASGRVFLFLISVLWLATGWLARPRLHVAGSSAFAVLLLLAMTGGLGMALAGDVLLFYTATTLAGYALYGVLMYAADAATLRAGRVLVILLVVSDLLVFELLLMLGQSAAGMDFAACRQAFLAAENQGLMLGLLIAGFGIKIGLLGFHFWLAPVFVTTGAMLRPALVAFMLGAGLLGGLRLLPLGELNMPVAGEMLQWLTGVTLAYAWMVGLLQVHRCSILAYAALALGGLWLAVLSALLLQPPLWQEAADVLATVFLQSGFALAALLLIENAIEGKDPPMEGYLVSGLRWLAAVLLATAPMGITGVITDRAAAVLIYSTIAVAAFLAASSLLRRDSVFVVQDDKNMRSGTGQTARSDISMPTAMMTAIGLTIAAALASGYQLVRSPFTETALAAFIALAAMLLAILSAKFRITRMPIFPPGDVLVLIQHGLALARHSTHRLADRGLTHWPEITRTLARRLWMSVSRIPIGQWESAFKRWPAALTFVLLLGLLVALMAGL